MYKDRLKKLGLKCFSKRNLQHIVNGHCIEGANYIGKFVTTSADDSIFFIGENFLELALEVCEKGIKVGEQKYVYDLGRFVGLNRMGECTSKVEVWLTKSLDGIRSVYPI